MRMTPLDSVARMVAESERHQAEWHKRAFQAEDDVD